MLSCILRRFAEVDASIESEVSLSQECRLDRRVLYAKNNPVSQNAVLARGAEVARFQEVSER